MDRYRFFPHMADAKFQAFGQTLEESFVHAALAVASLMWDWKEIAKKIDVPVVAKGNDLEQLLVNFLEEILYLLDTRNFLLGGIDRISLEKEKKDWVIRALFQGDVNVSGYEIFGDVKAITYNEMKIKNSAPFMVQVVADI